MWNARLDEAQAGIKIAGRSTNNLRYADDTTVMAESKEELESLLMTVKEESEKAGLKLNTQTTKIMASDPITSWQIDGETLETLRDFIFLGSKITADGDCSHEIKRRLLLGRKAMTNLAAKPLQSCPTLCGPIDGSPPGSLVPGILQTKILEWVAISFSNAWKWKVKVKSLSRVRLLESILKSRDVTLPTKVHLAKTMDFPVVMYGYERWTIKEGWVLKNWCFWTVVLEKTLEGPLECKEIKPVNPKGNQSWIFIGRTDAEAEAPILHPPDAKIWLTRKDPDAGKDWRQEEVTTEDEMVGWHHQLNGYEFAQILQEILKTRKPGVLQSIGSQRVRHNFSD